MNFYFLLESLTRSEHALIGLTICMALFLIFWGMLLFGFRDYRAGRIHGAFIVVLSPLVVFLSFCLAILSMYFWKSL